MSLCIRPVVETWGESLTYSGRDVPITDILEAIAGQIPEFMSGNGSTSVNSYGDLEVFYIEDGNLFLNHLERATVDAIMSELAEDSKINEDEEERARQREDVESLKAIAPSWRSSIDPQDGSLRIYCD